MSQAISLNQSTWASKLKAMGPGILMQLPLLEVPTLYPQLKLAVLTVGLYFSWSS